MIAVTMSYLLNCHKSLIVKKSYVTPMALSTASQEILRGLGGKWDHPVIASKTWILTFFSEGPPPVAVAHLRGKRVRAFYEEFVKLLDVKKSWDARALLVSAPGALNAEGVQLATNSGVYAILDGDKENLEAALGGKDISDVNRATQAILLGKRSRSASRECRGGVLELLSSRWMTLRELTEQLQWRFDARTVKRQVRSLQREERVCLRGRTISGEGLLGTPAGHYRMRSDLSTPTARNLLSTEILALLEGGGGTIDYREISGRLGIRTHVATASLRRLAKEGAVERHGGGWRRRKKE